MGEHETSFLQQVFTILQPVVLAALAWAAVHVASFIKARTKNEVLAGVLGRLNDAVFSVVREVSQTYVEALKDASADGKLTPEERSNAMFLAVSKAKEHLGAQGLKDLSRVFGIGTPEGVDAFLKGRIESALHAVNNNDVASPQ